MLPAFVQSQTSTMEFQPGTTIEVTAGADICADNVMINGSYTGAGTQCGDALPVEMVAMTAHAAARSVTLSWTTATETDNYGFEVERRTVASSELTVTSSNQQGTGNREPGTSWRSIGFVQGSGTSSSPREYSFLDGNLPSGHYAYRIRQIDQNGSFSYTAAVEVEVGLAPRVLTLSENYPNPFNPTTVIEFTVPNDGSVQLRIYNSLGQVIATLFNGEAVAGRIHQVNWDASSFATGTYFSKLQFEGKEITNKMLLMK